MNDKPIENLNEHCGGKSELIGFVMPEYKSDIYFGVIIRNESFLGWSAHDVGDGRMRFIHPDHEELRINKGLSNNWMKECWDDFISHAHQLEA